LTYAYDHQGRADRNGADVLTGSKAKGSDRDGLGGGPYKRGGRS